MNRFDNKSALLIIDMQKAFVEPGADFCIKGAKATVPACEKAIETARGKGSAVIWIKRQYREDGSDVEMSRKARWVINKPLTPGSEGLNSEEDAEGLERKPEDYVIIKKRWSAFFQTELDMLLRRLGTEKVFIAGTTTPNCIRTTCYDALALDYKTFIIENCCSSDSEEIQQANILDMKRAGAEVITLD